MSINLAVVVLCLANLALIGALPRIFFRPGRLNLRWWATAAPFAVAAGTLLGAAAGGVAPVRPPLAGAAPALDSLAALLSVLSVGLVGFTLGTHREPLALWHQDDDAPRGLVTHGAYARVRHPFYLAFLLTLAACAAAVPHPATAGALLYGVVRLQRTAVREERRLLRSAFGVEYAAYMRRSGRLWPRLRGTRRGAATAHRRRYAAGRA